MPLGREGSTYLVRNSHVIASLLPIARRGKQGGLPGSSEKFSQHYIYLHQWCRKVKKFGGPVIKWFGDNLPSPGLNRVNWSAIYWGGGNAMAPLASRFRHHWPTYTAWQRIYDTFWWMAFQLRIVSCLVILVLVFSKFFCSGSHWNYILI